MTDKFQIVLLIVSIALAAGAVELIRRGRVRVRYTVAWFASCLAFFLLALFPQSIGVIASALGVIYPPNAIFMVAIVCIIMLLAEFSAIATSLHRRNRELTKCLALLTWRLEQLETQQGFGRRDSG